MKSGRSLRENLPKCVITIRGGLVGRFAAPFFKNNKKNMSNTEKKKNYLLTPAQERSLFIRVNVLSDFAEMYRDNPDATPNRIMTALAQKYEVAIQSIRYILISSGVYEVAPEGGKPIIHTEKFPES